MSKVYRLRLVALVSFFVFSQLPLFGQLFRNLPRRTERQPAITSPADAKTQLQRLASEIKASPRKITDSDLNRCQRLLLDAVNDLQRRLPREFDRTMANDWINTFQLAELRITLGQKVPNSAILESVQDVFASDKEGILWTQFDGLRIALRRYQAIAQMLKEDIYERRLTNVCDNLAEFIEKYSEGSNPLYFATLTDAVIWLDDIGFFDPRAAKLADLTRAACSGVNVRLQIGKDFIVAGFVRELNEALDIDEVILGAKVVGSGTLSGITFAELVPTPNRAVIKVVANGILDTNTDGAQSMVTLKNHTQGTMHGEKQIMFAAEAISTTQAKSRANLNAELSDIQINAGPLIRRVARGQIDSRREDSLEEASRRAERRMNAQMNELIDPNIAKLNMKYQKIREAATKTGLFPRVWNLSSTADRIDWSLQLGNPYQPSAPVPAPELRPTTGLAVQVHQSSLNNMLSILLAGRSVDEEKFSERIGEFFDDVPKFLQRKSDETPAKVSFDGRVPVNVLFVDNKIRVVVRLNDIQVLDNAVRSFTISVEYRINMENRNGRNIIVLEQTEAEAFPIGFRPDGSVTLSTTQTVIRSYLMRRLEALPKNHEMDALELGGEWTGKGQLVPQFASTEKGWLTIVWNWKPTE